MKVNYKRTPKTELAKEMEDFEKLVEKTEAAIEEHARLSRQTQRLKQMLVIIIIAFCFFVLGYVISP